MNYKEALKYFDDLSNEIPLSSDSNWNKNYGLKKTEFLMEKLGNPHKGMMFVHVTGTSGKGSTSTLIASILKEAGYKTGLNLSPHVYSIRERMQINGEKISKDDFARILTQIQDQVDSMEKDFGTRASYFEILLAMSFIYFKEQNCDIVVLEVGIGGRLDPTNIIECNYQVITNIGLDHVEILGSTKEEILAEKQEIIKQDSIVVSGIEDNHLQELLMKKVESTNSQIFFAGKDFTVENIRDEEGNISLYFGDIKDLKLGPKGIFQSKNAAVAIEMAEKLKGDFPGINENAIRNGLLKASIPGRFEMISNDPLIILDGSHNQEKIKALTDSMASAFPNKKFLTLVYFKKREDFENSVDLLSRASSELMIFDTKNLKQKILHAKQMIDSRKDCGIIITGSFFVLEEAKKIISSL